jgi:acyl-CoA hydrolase
MNVAASQLNMTVLITPDMANFAGNVHGAQTLNCWIKSLMRARDVMRRATSSARSGDQVTFLQPIYVGGLLSFLPSDNDTDRALVAFDTI